MAASHCPVGSGGHYHGWRCAGMLATVLQDPSRPPAAPPHSSLFLHLVPPLPLLLLLQLLPFNYYYNDYWYNLVCGVGYHSSAVRGEGYRGLKCWVVYCEGFCRLSEGPRGCAEPHMCVVTCGGVPGLGFPDYGEVVYCESFCRLLDGTRGCAEPHMCIDTCGGVPGLVFFDYGEYVQG